MPLATGASKKAFSKNVKTEMHAGKSQAQSVAIAYSKKRESAKKHHARAAHVVKHHVHGSGY